MHLYNAIMFWLDFLSNYASEIAASITTGLVFLAVRKLSPLQKKPTN